MVLGEAGYFFSGDYENSSGVDQNMDYSEVGLMLGYTLGSGSVIHLHSSIMGGSASVELEEEDKDDKDDDKSKSSDFNMLHVEVFIEFNVTPWFRIAYGIGNRKASGVNLQDLEDSDFSGTSHTLLFRFGYF